VHALQDAEGANMWLGRAIKQAQDLPKGTTSPGASSLPTRTAPSAEPLDGVTEQQSTSDLNCMYADRRALGCVREEVMREGGVVLGFMTLDGEGVRQNSADAVRWFKLAATHGSREAEQVLGWVYNTGQFG